MRVVRLRIGMVLGTNGGALPALVAAARFGLGAVIGSGRQWVSWIHIGDAVRLIELCISTPGVRGAVNAVAPGSCTQRELQAEIASVLHRPLWLRVPARAIQLLLGEMSEILVSGQHVAPTRALHCGFEFRYGHLPHALRQLLALPRRRLAAGTPVVDAPDVFYNGDCPVCSAEIGAYAAHCARTASAVNFIDACRHPNGLTDYGLFRDHLERRLYMKTTDGRVYSGIEALVLLWGRMPGYRWLAAVVGNRAVKPLAELFYDHALSPTLYRWALRRQMGKRTELSAGG
jgi:uncharacterized protein